MAGMQSTESVRGGLTEAEELRRRRVVGTIIGMTGTGQRPETLRQNVGKFESRLCARLLEAKKLPFLSADYFNWRVDLEIWNGASKYSHNFIYLADHFP